MDRLPQTCHCNTCHLETSSIAGTRHRRCAGKVGVAPRKHKPRADKRGTWTPGSLPEHLRNEAA